MPSPVICVDCNSWLDSTRMSVVMNGRMERCDSTTCFPIGRRPEAEELALLGCCQVCIDKRRSVDCKQVKDQGREC